MELDDADRAMVASLVPDEVFVSQLITIVTYMAPDGTHGLKWHISSDEPLSSAVGAIEVAKYRMLVESTVFLDDDDGD